MRLDIVLSLAVLVDLTLLVLALVLMMRPACRSKGFLLLVYALTTGLNNDYFLLMKVIDRALGRGGALVDALTLPPAVNFAWDLLGRIALLLVIWSVVTYLVKEVLAARRAR